MKILIAPNAFKGTLSASDAAFIIARVAREALPEAEILALPLADGGAGTLEALIEATLGDFIEEECANALGERIIAPFGILGTEGRSAGGPKTAVVEIAACCGLKDVPVRKRNPLYTTTYGAGELLARAMRLGCESFIVGLGDSATHDCGAGIAQALGVKLLDKNGTPLGRGGAELLKLRAIDMRGVLRGLESAQFVAACDVANPLLGKSGTARVYAPQKGADAAQVKLLEEASAHFAEIVKKELGKDVGKLAGGGAAGGTGAGLAAFFGAELQSGAALVLDRVGFDERCRGAALVVTGEGAIDAKTADGKTVAGVCARAKKFNAPVVAFAGAVNEHDDALRNKIGLARMYCINPGDATEADAMKRARTYLAARLREALASGELNAVADFGK